MATRGKVIPLCARRPHEVPANETRCKFCGRFSHAILIEIFLEVFSVDIPKEHLPLSKEDAELIVQYAVDRLLT